MSSNYGGPARALLPVSPESGWFPVNRECRGKMLDLMECTYF